MNGFIYRIVNDINDKVYVGKTLLSLDKRFAKHKEDSYRKQKQVRPLYRAMNKYGCDKFHIELIEECPLKILDDREIFWIKFYDSYEKGYNATLGGDGKQIYDYNKIVNEFSSGKLICEIAEEFKCCQQTVNAALRLAQIDTKVNATKKNSKGLIAKDLNGNSLQFFSSRKEAAIWLQSNHYTEITNIAHIAAAIGRAANGK